MRLSGGIILLALLLPQCVIVVDSFTSTSLPYSHISARCEVVSSLGKRIGKKERTLHHQGKLFGDDDKIDSEENKDNNKITIDSIKEKFQKAISKEESKDDDEEDPSEKSSHFLSDFAPPAVAAFFTTVSTKLKDAQGVIISFFVGVLLTGGLILAPVISSVSSVSEPVALFETVLDEIDRSYVDEVDTNRLFETGVKAMLRSLDPYTEFESKKEAVALTESIDGKYGGVGLVISGMTPKDLAKIKAEERRTVAGSSNSNKLLPEDAVNERNDVFTSDGDDEDDEQERREEMKKIKRARENGISVVQAFEGYAFDYGMRVGDRLVSINDFKITEDTSVEDVRNNLRGEPGTEVAISFSREGVEGVQTVSMPRTIVKIRDVKLATLVGNKADGIGYIQLTGFTQDAGREMRNAIASLRYQAAEANGVDGLRGLILDLRGNPGGLLTSAVDVSSLFVPKNSDIVSARGRGFPDSVYRSRVDPFVDPSTKVAVLINENTASAAEIVTGAIQDLDVGVVIGSDRTFGKGLVQNVESLPFNTMLKYTVAKYYTPSGRCIQGINYVEGGDAKDGKYTANKVAAEDQSVFLTSSGRKVKDGGGIEADYKVAAEKSTPLRLTLLLTGLVNDFASQWSKNHQLTNDFKVDDRTYKEFQAFVAKRQKEGDIKLEELYSSPLKDLEKMLKSSGYKESGKELKALEAGIIKDMQRDFDKDSVAIKEDISQQILSRYYPQSMLIERSLKTDDQVQAAIKLVRNDKQFKTLLAKGSTRPTTTTLAKGTTTSTATTP